MAKRYEYKYITVSTTASLEFLGNRYIKGDQRWVYDYYRDVIYQHGQNGWRFVTAILLETQAIYKGTNTFHCVHDLVFEKEI